MSSRTITFSDEEAAILVGALTVFEIECDHRAALCRRDGHIQRSALNAQKAYIARALADKIKGA